jgi:hypothetical protein
LSTALTSTSCLSLRWIGSNPVTSLGGRSASRQ